MSAVVEQFWAAHQVGGPYDTLDASDEALERRAHTFPTLANLMPTVCPGQTVLDFGCGPGHDTLLYLEGGARHVYYADISAQALATTTRRLTLHGYPSTVATALIVQDHGPLLLPNADRVHCAGVLHHVSNPLHVLTSLRRALNPDGEIRLMVYSGDTSPHTQSRVPITRWLTKRQMTTLALTAGLGIEYVGSYPCSAEWRPDCNADCYRLVAA